MSLTVEVAGFGLCQTTSPYSVLVVCVQQETFQAWTVYRRYNSFVALQEQLQSLHPSVPNVPYFNADDLSIENLDNCRTSVDVWLRSLSSNPLILRTQSMYHFLCFDANMPPPYLEIHWRNSLNGSFDEMEMDDMFDRQSMEDEDMSNNDNGGSTGEIAGVWEDEEEISTGNQTIVNGTVWGIQSAGGAVTQQTSTQSLVNNTIIQNKNSINGGSSNGTTSTRGKIIPKSNKANKRTSDAMTAEHEDDERDGLDIQSLSVVEAEFLYDRGDEGKSAAEVAAAPKRTINLDAFHIIKVIGKGNYNNLLSFYSL